MQANNLIKEINSIINEGVYSKFTFKQLHQKLGTEAFLDYIESILFNAIDKGKFVTLKNLKQDSSMSVYSNLSKKKEETLVLRYFAISKTKDIVLLRYHRNLGRLDILRARRSLETNSLLGIGIAEINNKTDIEAQIKKGLAEASLELEKEIHGII